MSEQMQIQTLDLDVTTLQQSIDAFKVFNDKVQISIDDGSFVMQQIDPSHVCMTRLSMFTDSKIKAEFGISTEKLAKALAYLEACSMTIDDKVEKITMTDGISTYTIQTEDLGYEIPKYPTVNFTNYLKIKDIQNLKYRYKQLDYDYVEHIVKDGKLVLSTNDGQNKTEIKLDAEIIQTDELKALYTLEYLQSFVKTIPAKIGEIELRFSSRTPLEYTVNLSKGTLQFIMAPRVYDEVEEV
jgi:DNA polymerase III sliding clamp (beta) subunit (PCNA family)